MMTRRTLAATLVLALTISSWSAAGTLVDFKPLPVSPTTPEFRFDGPNFGPSFKSGPGSTSNGDGILPVPAQTAGGLDAETPFVIPAVPGSLIHPVPGTTEFFDSTLAFTGLVANGAATAFGGLIIQPLGPGTFDLLSTPAGGGPVLLLHGNIGGGTFIAGTGDAGAVFNSSNVDYTAGLIFNALVASGGNPNGNSMSFSMTDVLPGFSISGVDGMLNDFTANGTGLFNYNPVPEPTSLALLTLAATSLLIGRRR